MSNLINVLEHRNTIILLFFETTVIMDIDKNEDYQVDTNEPMTLEMLEQQLMQLQRTNKEPKMVKEYVEPKLPTTVEELEKELTQVGAKSFKQLEKKGRVMTTNDQNFILKMSMAQIAINDEYDDDFYNNVYLMVRREVGKNRQSSSDYLQLLVKGSKKKKETFTATLEKIIEKKKSTANIDFVIEGALGKVSSASSKKPRQAIEVPVLKMEFNEQLDGPLSSKMPLKMIEDIYEDVIELETWKRKAKATTDTELIEKNLNIHLTQLKRTFTNILSSKVPMSQLLNHLKMMRVLPRAFRFLPDDICISIVFGILESLDYCTLIVKLEQIESSINLVNSYLSGLATKVTVFPADIQSSFSLVCDYLYEFEIWQNTASSAIQSTIMDMEYEDLNKSMKLLLKGITLSAVIRTKVGIYLLTAILSRAHVLKSNCPNDEFDELFDIFYNQVKPYLSMAFPLQQVNFPHPQQLAPWNMTPEEYVLVITNDVHVWQFLAAMVISANAHQQTEIVSEVRDRVMWNATGSFEVGQSLRYTYTPDESFNKLAGKRAVANVNLFLHSLGFDSSQL
eukprot:NODE_351_length_10383_cov_0.336153.p2 type:complete len:565 gc:universal NODE_351_length_10383_cov_0.336153:5321-7015(+)